MEAKYQLSQQPDISEKRDQQVMTNSNISQLNNSNS